MRKLGQLALFIFKLPILLLLGVTPVHASWTFRTRSGNISVDSYISDVANGLVTFDDGQGASATSSAMYICPTDMLLVDVAITTGPTVMGRLMVTRNSIPTGNILGIIPHVDTSPQRPLLNIPFASGHKLTAIQLAV